LLYIFICVIQNFILDNIYFLQTLTHSANIWSRCSYEHAGVFSA